MIGPLAAVVPFAERAGRIPCYLEGVRDRSLIEACNDLAKCLRPGGPDGEIDEWSIYDESLRRLVSWAEEAGCFYEGLQPLKDGGREHDLTFVEEGNKALTEDGLVNFSKAKRYAEVIRKRGIKLD